MAETEAEDGNFVQDDNTNRHRYENIDKGSTNPDGNCDHNTGCRHRNVNGDKCADIDEYRNVDAY